MKRIAIVCLALSAVFLFQSCFDFSPEPDPDELALIFDLEVDGKKAKFQPLIEWGYTNGEVTHYIFRGEHRKRNGTLPDPELYVFISMSVNGGESNTIGSNNCYVRIGGSYDDSVFASTSNTLSVSVSETDIMPAGNRWDGTINLSDWNTNGSSYDPPEITGTFSARNLSIAWEENGIDPSTVGTGGGGGSNAPFLGTWTYNLCGSSADSWVSFCSDGSGAIFLAECSGACAGDANPGSLNPFTWKDNGSTIEITYGPAVICDEPDNSINGTSDESEYSISGNNLSYAGVTWSYSTSVCKLSN